MSVANISQACLDLIIALACKRGYDEHFKAEAMRRYRKDRDDERYATPAHREAEERGLAETWISGRGRNRKSRWELTATGKALAEVAQ